MQELGYSIMSTGGTGKHLKANGVDCDIVLKIQEGRPNIGDMVKNGDIAMMLITSTGAAPCMNRALRQSYCECCSWQWRCIGAASKSGNSSKLVVEESADVSTWCMVVLQPGVCMFSADCSSNNEGSGLASLPARCLQFFHFLKDFKVCLA